MVLSKVRLGDYLQLLDNRNTDLKYGVDDVRGINNQKKMIRTKVDMTERSFLKFYVVNPGEFIFNHRTSRNGDKFSITYNYEDRPYIFTEDYVVFKVKDECEEQLDPIWLYLFFCRSEFDRYVITNSWGSSTEFYNWRDLCDIVFELPPIEIQRKYVAIYNAMAENQKAYEQGLEDLKLTCDGYIEDLRKRSELKPIGRYITPLNEKNSNGEITLEQGINIDKKFITPQRSNSNLEGRKIVRKGQFAYCTQLNNEHVAIAYRTQEDCVVSSVYDVFEITKKDELVPEYLMLWLIRTEFGRFVYWASEGSAYEFLNYKNLANYMIPVPSFEVQKVAGKLYSAYVERQEINEQLKAQIKDICPILIKGSLEEARV